MPKGSAHSISRGIPVKPVSCKSFESRSSEGSELSFFGDESNTSPGSAEKRLTSETLAKLDQQMKSIPTRTNPDGKGKTRPVRPPYSKAQSDRLLSITKDRGTASDLPLYFGTYEDSLHLAQVASQKKMRGRKASPENERRRPASMRNLVGSAPNPPPALHESLHLPTKGKFGNQRDFFQRAQSDRHFVNVMKDDSPVTPMRLVSPKAHRKSPELAGHAKSEKKTPKKNSVIEKKNVTPSSNRSTVKQKKMGISVSDHSAKKKSLGQASTKQNDPSKGPGNPETTSNGVKGDNERMVTGLSSSAMTKAASLFNFPIDEWDGDSNTTPSGHQDGRKEGFVEERKTSLSKPVTEHNEKKLDNTEDSLHKPMSTRAFRRGKNAKPDVATKKNEKDSAVLSTEAKKPTSSRDIKFISRSEMQEKQQVEIVKSEGKRPSRWGAFRTANDFIRAAKRKLTLEEALAHGQTNNGNEEAPDIEVGAMDHISPVTNATKYTKPPRRKTSTKKLSALKL
jgi:hypothetical protein